MFKAHIKNSLKTSVSIKYVAYLIYFDYGIFDAEQITVFLEWIADSLYVRA